MQNILSKAIKYALFDPTKEMAYIPLDQESKVRVRKSVCKCVHQRSKCVQVCASNKCVCVHQRNAKCVHQTSICQVSCPRCDIAPLLPPPKS